jgi:hypothetical protein
MEGREKPHTDKYKKIMNDYNYDASCTLRSLGMMFIPSFHEYLSLVSKVIRGGAHGHDENISLSFLIREGK